MKWVKNSVCREPSLLMRDNLLHPVLAAYKTQKLKIHLILECDLLSRVRSRADVYSVIESAHLGMKWDWESRSRSKDPDDISWYCIHLMSMCLSILNRNTVELIGIFSQPSIGVHPCLNFDLRQETRHDRQGGKKKLIRLVSRGHNTQSSSQASIIGSNRPLPLAADHTKWLIQWAPFNRFAL